MKDSTRKAVEYLCTPEGKAYYKERLAYHFGGYTGTAEDWEPICDRFCDYALADTVERAVPFPPEEDLGFLSDTLLDAYGYEKNDGTYWSKIPRIMARVTKFDTMADKFAWAIDPYMP